MNINVQTTQLQRHICFGRSPSRQHSLSLAPKVVFRIIIPETEHLKCNYAQFLLAEGDGTAVGHPEHFVSHPWAAKWGHLLEALRLYDTQCVYFLDIFAINQHRDNDGEFQRADLAGLEGVLSAIASTVIFFHPW